jgi:hypothetical protein
VRHSASGFIIPHGLVRYENRKHLLGDKYASSRLRQQNNTLPHLILKNNTTFNSENAILAAQLAFWCLQSTFSTHAADL